MTRFKFSRIAGLLIATILVAGCDKCGERLKLNVPTLPTNACGANVEPAK